MNQLPKKVSLVLMFLFMAIAVFHPDPIMVARSWVVWPIMAATAIVCWQLEERSLV